MQGSSQTVTTNKPTPKHFYGPDALPVAQATVSEPFLCQYLFLVKWPVISKITSGQARSAKGLPDKKYWGFLVCDFFIGQMPFLLSPKLTNSVKAKHSRKSHTEFNAP